MSASDVPTMQLFFGENVDTTSVGDDFVGLFTNEIVEILQVHDNEIEGQIVNNLLENGRRSLVKYEEDIIPRTYKEVMKGNNNKLMISLKKYFRQKWESQYGVSNQWFISFLKQYENGENHDIYERILIRTAEYGNMYMKDCPILSIVLQLLFERIDDDCLKGTNVFDDLWYTITNNGLKSITNYSDYVIEKVMNEQLKSQSVLFQALRGYYRENVFLSLKQSTILNKENLYELALDNVAEHGWVADMKSVKDNVSPRSYRMLLEKLRSFHTTVNGKQEPEIQVNQPEINQSKMTVDTQNQPLTEETPADTTSVPKTTTQPDLIEASVDAADADTQSTITQKDVQSKREEFDNVDDPGNNPGEAEVGGTANSQIFISGLPSTMSEQRLLDTLWYQFNPVGAIKINQQTNKPCVYLFRRKGCPSQLNGTATITFEKAESVTKAIEKYNETYVPLLNDVRILVQLFRTKCTRPEITRASTPTRSTRPASEEYSRKDKDANRTTGKQQNPEESDDSDDTRNISDEAAVGGIANSKIFITGLPWAMAEQRLFDTIWDVFNSVGPIKMNKRTNKPYICLFKRRDKPDQLSGTATVTFKKEKSVMKAIEKYNKKRVPIFNDARICVRKEEIKKNTPTEPRATTPLDVSLPRPVQEAPLPRPGPAQPDGTVNVFWDIENVAIPFGQNAFDIVMRLRQLLIVDRNLAEGSFTAYCQNVPPQHRNDLSHANVDTKLVTDGRRQSADRQIYMDLQVFKVQQKTPATIVLISGDIDFIQFISDLRFRSKHYVIVIHNPQANPKLLKTANEAYPWHQFTGGCRRVERNVVRTSSPKHVPRNTRKVCPLPMDKSLTKLNSDEIMPETVDHILESTSSVVDYPTDAHQLTGGKPRECSTKTDFLESETAFKGNQHENEKSPDAPAVPSPVKRHVPKKTNKVADAGRLFCCSTCDSKFTTDPQRAQHERDKHKVSTLVELFSLTQTDHDKPNSKDNHPNIDLMAFHDDDDFDPLRPSLLTTTRETINLMDDMDDNDNPHEPLLKLNDALLTSQTDGSARLQANSGGNEKVIEIDIDKNTSACE